MLFYVSVMVLVLIPSLNTSSVNLKQQVLHGLQYNQEIILISDASEDFHLTSNSFMSSVVPRESASIHASYNISWIVKNAEMNSKNVALLIDLVSPKEIFDKLGQIGETFEQFHTIHRIWVIVLWPQPMKSTKEIESIKNAKEFVSAISHFHLSSLVYFVFNLTRGKREVEEMVVVYESYITGGYITFYFVSNGFMDFMCDYCQGMALRRFNFHQRKLKVTAVNDTEVNDDIHIFEDANGIRYGKDGFTGSIHEILKQLLNFTTQPMLSDSFGSYNETTKQWGGAIGDTSRGIADIGLSITILQPERARVVSFLPPADEHLINAFFVPSDDRPIRDIFFQPFEPLLWAAVITTWVMLASCMLMFTKIRHHYGITSEIEDSEGSDIAETEVEHDFSNDYFIWAIGTACQQGWDEHPKAGSLRAIFISGSFTGVVAYAGYSAAIVSTLSMKVDPIQTPMQLLTSNLHVGIRKGFISSLLEQENASDVMSKFYEKIGRSHKSEQYLNVSCGLDRLLTHRYAFITTRDTIYDLMKTTKDDKLICGVKDMSILKYGFPLGYPVPKFSPFREVLRYAMTMIREPGILYRLRMKHSFQRRCLDVSESVGYVLALGDMFTAFVILLAGFTASLVILAWERFMSIRNVHHKEFIRLP